jgi:tetratricopeptide (TPR) repeat protein
MSAPKRQTPSSTQTTQASAPDTTANTEGAAKNTTRRAVERPDRFRRRALVAFLLALCAVGVGRILAQDWQETTRREATLPQLESLSRRDPSDGRLLALLAARRLEAQEYAGAIEALTNAAGLGEQNEAVWLTWSASYAAQNDLPHALGVLRLGMRNPAVTHPLQEALQRAERLGRTPSPIALATAICPQGIHWLSGRYTQGSLLNGFFTWRGKRDPEHSGFATREQWAASAPSDARAQRLWGEALTANHRYIEAETTLRHALTLDPTSPRVHLALAYALEGQKAFGKAGLEYIACLKREPNNVAALIGMGRVALEKKLLPIGVEVYEKAVKLTPNDADAWIGLGKAHYAQRLNLGRALDAFTTVARLAPDRTDYFVEYSNTLRGQSRYDEAEAVMRRRLAVTPDDPQCHFLLGLLLLDHNASPEREVEAEKELRESLRLQPETAAVEARLGRLMLERGQVQEAILMLQSTLRHDLYNLEATLALARAYRQAGRIQEAQTVQAAANQLSAYLQRTAFLEDQVHRQPDNLKANVELAALYRQGGETEKAKRQDDMVYVLKTHPQQAKRGLMNVQRATSLTVPSNDSGAGH